MSTIKFKLISVFSIIYIAVCIIILIASYFFMHSSMVNTMASVYTNSLSLVEQRLLTIQSSASTIANVFYENESVKNALLTDSLNRSIALESRAYISSLELANSSLIEDLNIPFYITIVGDNGFTYTSLRGKDFYDYEQITNSKWFKQLKFKSTEDICFFTNITDSDFLGYSSSNFVAAKNIFDDHDIYKGTILVSINESLFLTAFRSIVNDSSQIYLIDNSTNEIINTDNTPNTETAQYFPLSVQQFLNKSNKPYIITDVDNESYLVTKYASEPLGYTILYKISMNHVEESLYGLSFRLLLLILVCIVAYVIIISILVRHITSPLAALSKALTNINVSNPVPITTETRYSEISEILTSFNDMQKRISTLMTEAHEKDKKINNAEINFLLAQINPHFINNTLFSIKCTIEMGKNEKAAKKLSLLTSLLKSTLLNNDNDISLIEEFALIEMYVQLQQLRYGSSLVLNCILPSSLEHALIMRNLLQPIVENSIFHGLKNSEDSLHITISARDNGDVLTIVIADNGIGIPEDKLGTLLSNNISTKKHHIGLNNVNTRIKLYYGYEYGLTISSAENEGTIVIIKLPLTFENAEE